MFPVCTFHSCFSFEVKVKTLNGFLSCSKFIHFFKIWEQSVSQKGLNILVSFKVNRTLLLMNRIDDLSSVCVCVCDKSVIRVRKIMDSRWVSCSNSSLFHLLTSRKLAKWIRSNWIDVNIYTHVYKHHQFSSIEFSGSREKNVNLQ